MIITVRMAGGKKITREHDKIDFFIPTEKGLPMVEDGHIMVNLTRVEYIRAAYSEELEHSKNHGY